MSSLCDAITAFSPSASKNMPILSLTSFLSSRTNFPFVQEASTTFLFDLKRCTAPCPPLPFPDGRGAHRWRSWHHLGLGEQYHKPEILAFCNSSCQPASILLVLYCSSRLVWYFLCTAPSSCIGVDSRLGRSTVCFFRGQGPAPVSLLLINAWPHFLIIHLRSVP